MPSVVMTLIGKDRPGLVESVAAVVVAHNANWTESRMAHLAGQFAGILHVVVPQSQIEALVGSLEQLGEVGLSVSINRDESTMAAAETAGNVVLLEVVGNDRPGIVREVSQVLTSLKINVENFQTECRTAPMSGGQLFHATAQLNLPDETSESQLRTKLEGIAADLMVDISLTDS